MNQKIIIVPKDQEMAIVKGKERPLRKATKMIENELQHNMYHVILDPQEMSVIVN